MLSKRRLQAFGLASLLVVCVSPSHGEPEKSESTVETRKAHRYHPVAFQAAADRPIIYTAVRPAESYLGIPRAIMIRKLPVQSEVESPTGAPSARVKRMRPTVFPRRKRVERGKPQPNPVIHQKRREDFPPSPSVRDSLRSFPASPSTASLVRRCDVMALQELVYKFGADDPSTGGLDCSGAVQYLLRQEGIREVPRTAYTQYLWLKKLGALNKVSRWTWSAERVSKKMRSGDLMFWTGTYNTGRSPNISHVMIYLGRDASNGKHYMFGASSRKSKGLHGNAVDVYEFVYPRKHGKDNFAGFASVPGLRR